MHLKWKSETKVLTLKHVLKNLKLGFWISQGSGGMIIEIELEVYVWLSEYAGHQKLTQLCKLTTI